MKYFLGLYWHGKGTQSTFYVFSDLEKEHKHKAKALSYYSLSLSSLFPADYIKNTQMLLCFDKAL
jgi:hypothetical protein